MSDKILSHGLKSHHTPKHQCLQHKKKTKKNTRTQNFEKFYVNHQKLNKKFLWIKFLNFASTATFYDHTFHFLVLFFFNVSLSVFCMFFLFVCGTFLALVSSYCVMTGRWCSRPACWLGAPLRDPPLVSAGWLHCINTTPTCQSRDLYVKRPFIKVRGTLDNFTTPIPLLPRPTFFHFFFFFPLLFEFSLFSFPQK